MVRWARAVVLAAGAATLCAVPGPLAAVERSIEGELVRVDVGKRILVVRPSRSPAHEIDVAVEAGTMVTAAGRVVALEELKALERIAVICDDPGSEPCRATRIAVGPARHAVGPAGPP